MGVLKGKHFFIDKDKVRKDKEEYNKRYKEAKQEKEAQMMYEYVGATKDLLHSLRKRLHSFSFPSIKLPKRKIRLYYRDLYEYIPMYNANYFIKIMNDSDIVESEYDIDEELGKRELSFNNQERLIRKLFSFDKTSKSMIRDVLNPDNHMFEYNKWVNNFFLNYENNNYVCVNKRDTINGFLALCHEFGHMYEAYVTGDDTLTYNNDFTIYREIFSLFFEMRGVECLYNSGIINELEKIKLINKIIDENTFDSSWGLNFMLAEGQKMSVKEIIHYVFLNNNPKKPIIYTTSCLIALKLYDDSLRDFGKTIYNLKRFITNYDYKDSEDLIKKCEIETDEVCKTFKKYVKSTN